MKLTQAGRAVNYSGENFDENGESAGFFTGFLVGIADVRFDGDIDAKLWTKFSGTIHDVEKPGEYNYSGRRATTEEEKTKLGESQERKQLVQKVLKEF